MEHFDADSHELTRCEYAEERLKAEKDKVSAMVKIIKILSEENKQLKKLDQEEG